jgi:hypothetical protein
MDLADELASKEHSIAQSRLETVGERNATQNRAIN